MKKINKIIIIYDKNIILSNKIKLNKLLKNKKKKDNEIYIIKYNYKWLI